MTAGPGEGWHICSGHLECQVATHLDGVATQQAGL